MLPDEDLVDHLDLDPIFVANPMQLGQQLYRRHFQLIALPNHGNINNTFHDLAVCHQLFEKRTGLFYFILVILEEADLDRFIRKRKNFEHLP